MAYQLPSGTDANFIAAHNTTHQESVGLTSATSHYDGPEFLITTGVEQVPSVTVATATTLATAIDAVNETKRLYNDHLGRHNSGSGKKIYAHKAVDATNVATTADMASGSSFESTMLTDLAALVTELRADYASHIANTKADGTSSGVHVVADTTNILGGTPTISTFADVAEGLNNLKAQFNAHIAFSSGGSPHANPDGTNAVSTANASSTDLDSLRALANALRTAITAHYSQATVHTIDDTFNPISGSAVSYPSGMFTLANEIKADYNLHRASTTYHESADGTNTISSSDATTVASLITLAAELQTDITAHLRRAPVTRAVR